MMDKLHNLDPQTRKTISLLGTLLVVIILSLGVLYYSSDSGEGADVQQDPDVQQIDPAFNRRVLDEVRQASDDRPSLGGSVGKSNPYSDF